MLGKSMIDIVTIIIATGAALAINRSAVKKQTIADLKDLVEVQQLKIERLEEKIEELEAIIDGNPELVREGTVAGGHGPRSGDSSAHSKTTKNRSSR